MVISNYVFFRIDFNEYMWNKYKFLSINIFANVEILSYLGQQFFLIYLVNYLYILYIEQWELDTSY